MRYALKKKDTQEILRYEFMDTEPAPLSEQKNLEWVAAPLPEVSDELPLYDVKKILARQIDDYAAGIYQKWERFGREYELREAQAIEYKDAGYTGDVPRQVAAFADRAGLPYQQATDLILTQAEILRQAADDIGDLRMRKYEILNAEDAAGANAKHMEINALMEAIAENIQ